MYSTTRQQVKAIRLLAAPHAPLAVIFIHGDFHPRGPSAGAPLDCCQQSLAQILGQKLGGRVADRQEDAVGAGKEPAAAIGREDRLHFLLAGLDANQRMTGRQQNMMIELVGERLQFIAEGDEVDHILIFIEWSLNLDRDAVVMPMQSLAHIATKRDEVCGREDVLFFFEADAVHGNRFKFQVAGFRFQVSGFRLRINAACAT